MRRDLEYIILLDARLVRMRGLGFEGPVDGRCGAICHGLSPVRSALNAPTPHGSTRPWQGEKEKVSWASMPGLEHQQLRGAASKHAAQGLRRLVDERR